MAMAPTKDDMRAFSPLVTSACALTTDSADMLCRRRVLRLEVLIVKRLEVGSYTFSG
jgi:hypothetical protein